jgi:hypothetical protein
MEFINYVYVSVYICIILYACKLLVFHGKLYCIFWYNNLCTCKLILPFCMQIDASFFPQENSLYKFMMPNKCLLQLLLSCLIKRRKLQGQLLSTAVTIRMRLYRHYLQSHMLSRCMFHLLIMYTIAVYMPSL